MDSLVLLALAGAATLVVVLVAPALVWRVRAPFLFLNWLQWALMAPWRPLLRDPRTNTARLLYCWLFVFGLAYWIVAYVALAPLRLVNALYFDVVLFWSVALRDGLADLLWPSYPGQRGLTYALRWLVLLPVRVLRVAVTSCLVLFQGIVTVGFDLIWPAVTLFHGTELCDPPHGASPARDILRTGRWKVGPGAHIGTGLYFAVRERVAEHYARRHRRPAVVVARVTLDPCRPVSTLAVATRRQIGANGRAIREHVRFPWVVLEHWRSGGSTNWYELCLLQDRGGPPAQTWRVRPLCVVAQGVPQRVEGGPALWPGRSGRAWALLVPSLAALVVLVPLWTVLVVAGVPEALNGVRRAFAAPAGLLVEPTGLAERLGTAPPAGPTAPSFRPFWVKNHVRQAELWSGPPGAAGVRSLGRTSQQWCWFEVRAPQTSSRLYVYNPYAREHVWIDASAVGPVEPPTPRRGQKPPGQTCADVVYSE